MTSIRWTLLWLLWLLSLPAPLCARDLAAMAQAEYRQCLKDTAEAAQGCSFGGCGNIQASCYQRQQAVFDEATERVAGRRDLAQGALRAIGAAVG